MKRILVADDDKAILEVYRKILSASPGTGRATGSGPIFDPVICESAEDALEATKTAIREERPFALAFLDIHMPPGHDGVWAAEHIRMLDPNIGIVLVSGYSDMDLEKAVQRVPPPDKLLYLQKPFVPKEIWQLAAAMGTKWQSEKALNQMRTHLEALVYERTRELENANAQLELEMKRRGEVENALRNSEGNFRNMILNSGDGLLIVDENMKVRFANPTTELLFEKGLTDLVGTPFGFPLLAGKTTELDIFRKNQDSVVVEMSVAETEWEGENAYLASLRDITEHKRLRANLQEGLRNIETTLRGTIQAMARAVEIRDPYTSGHQQRVASISRSMAEEMGLAPDRIEGIWLAALVHDIGKICIPAEILSRPGKLRLPELKIIQFHPEDGHDILKDIPFPWPIAQSVLQHQERSDGSGYPRGLSGEEIILEARILAIADVVEAMASHRPYRPALGITSALEEVSRNRGKHFDPEVVDVCMKLFREKNLGYPETPPPR